MKNTNNKTERVEVMALFGYEMTPCQPLSFRRRGEADTEVTEMLRSYVKFVAGKTLHMFDVLAGGKRCVLEFDSSSLAWHLA